ncbi:MAG: thioredoxin family protein [Campylobacterales bacterium]|nr:thioredoxin family protein [Campylobacterales bacterium]
MKLKYLSAAILTVAAFAITSCSDTAKETKTAATSENVSSQSIKTVSGKINMIFVTQDGCGACERLKAVMQREAIKPILASKFNVIFIDISKAGVLPKGLEEPYGTPTLYFINSNNEQIIGPMVGGKDETNFKEVLDEAISAYDAKYPAEEK